MEKKRDRSECGFGRFPLVVWLVLGSIAYSICYMILHWVYEFKEAKVRDNARTRYEYYLEKQRKANADKPRELPGRTYQVR